MLLLMVSESIQAFPGLSSPPNHSKNGHFSVSIQSWASSAPGLPEFCPSYPEPPLRPARAWPQRLSCTPVSPTRAAAQLSSV